MIALKITTSVVLILALFGHQGYGQTSNPLKQKEVEPKFFSGHCEEPNGRYAVDGQCDAYVECVDGVAEEKLCPDGLLFNAKVGLFTFPCQYPIDVDCTTRARLQPPQATEECPHQFGYYRVGDSSHCGQFKNCANGRGFTLNCPSGLAFNQATYQCDWPDLVPDCDAEAFLGFQCPPEARVEGLGAGGSKFYKSNDCQRYFLCIDGRPRLHECGIGSAYNELISSCDDAENVPGCESLALPKSDEDDENESKSIQLTKTLNV